MREECPLAGGYLSAAVQPFRQSHLWEMSLQLDEEPEMTVKDLDIAAAEEDLDEARILCARCYSLSHYG
jgi:hypothetical protein